MPDLKPTVDFLAAAPGAVLLTHERPDGDALGSVAGLRTTSRRPAGRRRSGSTVRRPSAIRICSRT